MAKISANKDCEINCRKLGATRAFEALIYVRYWTTLHYPPRQFFRTVALFCLRKTSNFLSLRKCYSCINSFVRGKLVLCKMFALTF